LRASPMPRTLRLTLLAAVGLVAVVLLPTQPAQAAPPATTVTSAAVSPAVLATPKCLSFSDSNFTGYVGYHCINFEKTGTSMRAIGSTTCRFNKAAFACNGVIDTVTITLGSATKSETYTCGVYDPSIGCTSLGAFGPTPHIFCPPTGAHYVATVRSKVLTPDGVTLRSADLSNTWTTNC
jgi:hypothetical protein